VRLDDFAPNSDIQIESARHEGNPMNEPVEIAPPSGLTPSVARLSQLPGMIVQVNGQVALAEQRHHTMSTVAATLAVSGQVAYASVTERDGSRWTITIGAVPDHAER
jgi:hypothetical protein